MENKKCAFNQLIDELRKEMAWVKASKEDYTSIVRMARAMRPHASVDEIAKLLSHLMLIRSIR